MTTPHEKVEQQEKLHLMSEIQAMIQKALIENDITPEEALRAIEDDENDEDS